MGQLSKICYIEIQVEVEAEYTPAQPAEMPSPRNETGTPPEGEEFEIISVMTTDAGTATNDILSALSPEQLGQLEEQVKEQLGDDDYDEDRMYTRY